MVLSTIYLTQYGFCGVVTYVDVAQSNEVWLRPFQERRDVLKLVGIHTYNAPASDLRVYYAVQRLTDTAFTHLPKEIVTNAYF